MNNLLPKLKQDKNTATSTQSAQAKLATYYTNKLPSQDELRAQVKKYAGVSQTKSATSTQKKSTSRQSSLLSQTTPSTSRQSLLASSNNTDKWYKGDQPTLSETVSRIYDIGSTNSSEASKMMLSLSALQDDPTSIFYNPYTKATNKAISEISALGIDVSGGITDDWLAKYSYLKGFYRTESTYSPLAPAKKSTTEQDAAYWYYKILQAEDDTKEAEQEWSALQEEITYWAQRTDRNYSDDEILSKIDWDNYKTLQKMDEQKALGVPQTFNREIGYSQDALKGVIWAARNGSTGNTLDDSVNAVRGVGRQWTDNADIREALDPTSENYSPYKVGSTLDDAALYFNVSAFDKNWLDENRAMLASGDDTKVKMYQKVYSAETFTQQAENELEALNADIDRYLSMTSDPDRILNNIKGKYSTLEKLDESMEDGDLIDTTRAIDYRWQDIEAEVRKRCEEQNTAVGGQTFATDISNTLGVTAYDTQSGSAVSSTRDNAINAAGATIADSGTEAEQVVFKNAYSSDFETCLSQINTAVKTGDIAPQTAYDLLLAYANQYTAKNGFKALETIQEYKKQQNILQQAIQALKEYGVEYDPNGEADITENLVNINDMGASLSDSKKIATAGVSDVRAAMREEDYEYIDDEIFMLREEIENGYGENEFGERVRLTDDEITQKKARLAQLEAISKGTASEEEQQAYADEAAYMQETAQAREQERAEREVEYQSSIARQREINSLIATISDTQEYLTTNQTAYDNALKTQSIMTDGYKSAAALQGKNNSVAGGTAVLTALETAVQIGSEYSPTEWTTASLYDLAESVADVQGYTHESIVDAARSGLEQSKLALEQVQNMLDVLDENGVEISKEYSSNIKRYQASLERDIKDAEYYLLRETSGFADTATQEAEKIYYQVFADYNSFNTFTKIKGQFFGDKQGYSYLDNAIASQLLYESGVSDVNISDLFDSKYEIAREFTKEECLTYMYIRSTDGEDAAKEYYDHMTDATYGVINMRRNLSNMQIFQGLADKYPVSTSVLTVIASPLKLAGTIQTAADTIMGREINPYSAGYMPSQGISAARSTIAENISEDLGGGFVGWLGSLGYNVVMSTADSMTNSMLFGGIGQSVGENAGKLLSKASIRPEMIETLSGMVASFTTSSFMGASAAGDVTMSAKLKGANDSEALLLGGIAYLSETLSETIELESVDALVHLGAEREFRSALTKGLYGMLNEGVGEAASELAESIADRVILDTRSDWQSTVDEYRTQGYTEDKAKELAWRNIVANSLEAALSGALSSGLHGAVGYVQGALNANEQQSTEQIMEQVISAMQTTNEQTQDTVQETTPAQSEQQETAQDAPQQAQEPETANGQATEQASGETVQTQNKAKEQQSDSVTRQVTVLSEALGSDDASRTASIAAVLLGEETGVMNTDTASAAAQYMSDQLGSENAVRVVRDTLLTDADTQGASIALKTAALNEGGVSSQILQNMATNGVTAEQIEQMKQAAAVELNAPDTVRQMQQKIFDNQVAMRTAQLVGDGALNAVQPYEEAVDQAKSALKQANSDLSKQKKRQKALGENLRAIQAEINNSEYSAQQMDLFRQTIKDLDGQNKVVKEYEQRKANAEEALTSAQNKLDQIRDTALGKVRQQALSEVQEAYTAMQEQATQQAEEQAKASIGYQKKQFIPYEGAVPQNVDAVQQETVAIDDASYAQVQQIIEDAQADGESNSSVRSADGAENVNTPYNTNSDIQYSLATTTDTAAGESGKTKTVSNPIQIVKKLAKTLDTGAFLGTRKLSIGDQKISSRKVRGYYNSQAGYIVARAGEASEYAVTMHEIGHTIAHKTGMTGTQQMVDNLPQEFQDAYENDNDTLLDEAFAEFVRMYMSDSKAAANFAGSTFVNSFENALRKADIANDVHSARDQLQTYLAANAMDKIKAFVVDKADANNRNKKSLADRIRSFRRNWQSWSIVLDPLDALVYDATGEYGTIRQTAKRRNMNDRIVNALVNVALTDSQGTIQNPKSLADVFEPIDASNESELTAYWLAKHSLSRDAQGKAVFNSDIDAQSAIAQTENSALYDSVIEEAEQWLYDFRQYWLVDTGFMTQEMNDKFKAIYPYYLPTVRVMDGKGGSGAKDTFIMHSAKGSDLEIINPFDALMDNITRIVGMNTKNAVGVAVHNAAQRANFGYYMRQIDADSKKVSVATDDVKAAVTQVLENADTDTNVIDEVLSAIGDNVEKWQKTKDSTEGNVMRVVLPDGSDVYYQFTPEGREIYEVLTGNGKATHQDIKQSLRFFSSITGFVSRLNTSASLVFPMTNAIRDQLNAINYGSYGVTNLDGVYDWCKSFYQVVKGSDSYKQYLAMGGGGYTRIDTNTRAGTDQYRSMLFKGYEKRSVGSRVKAYAEKAVDIVTLEQLQDWVETTTRYTEFAYGKHDLSTPEGRAEAFQAAQDVTTDFSDSGDGIGLAIAKAFIPFINANIQGNARAIDEFSGRQRKRLAPRMIKRATNTLILTGIAAAARELLLSDEDKELYARLSDDMKLQYYVLPNFINSDSDRRFIRIPISQDPIDILMHTVAEATIEENSETDDLGALLKAGGTTLISNMTYSLSDVITTDGTLSERLNAFMSGTVLSPLWAASTNLNYYGGNIESDYLRTYKSAELRYNDSTSDMFIALGQRIGVSPVMLQYMFEQVSGYGGTLLVSTVDKQGNIFKAIQETFHKRFTIDSAYSNDISSAYADNKEMLEQFKMDVSNDQSDSGFLRLDLSETEKAQAYEEAKAMFAAGGLFKTADARISECWNEINEMRNDESLSDAVRNQRTLALRDEIVEIQLSVNEQVGEFYANYVTGDSWYAKLLSKPQSVTPFTTYEKLDETFLNDADADYMQKAKAVWEETGNDSALPHPNTSFTSGGETNVIGEDDWAEWVQQYKQAYQESLSSYDLEWEEMTSDEQVKALKAAHTNGHNAAKKWYIEEKKKGSMLQE